MVEWMRDVLEVFKSPVETFFLSVAIMDLYFNEETEVKRIDELHEIGVTSILIASKFSELEPLSVELMHKKAAHGKISCESIIERERVILNTIGFNVAIPTVYTCFETYLSYFSESFDMVKEHNDEVREEAIRLMTVAMLNFRFTFEMKPTQLTLVILKMSLKFVEDKHKLTLLSDDLKDQIQSQTLYTKGKMNGIEKRLHESFSTNS